MENLTDMQKLVSKAWNSYPDDIFIEMVNNLDEENKLYWEQCDLESLSDEECVDVLNRLLSMFFDWNHA